MFIHRHRSALYTTTARGVDPYGTGGHVPPIFGLGDIITNVPLNISSYFLSMQYFLDKLKEFLVFLVFSRLVQGVVGTL